MLEALIFTDDNEDLRDLYAKPVRVASIALICASAIYGVIAIWGAAALWDSGANSDDLLVLAGFAGVSVLYAVLAVRKWAHITFAIATVASATFLVFLMGSAAIELLDRVDEVSLILLALTAGQVAVTGLVARGWIFGRKLRKLRFEIYPQ